MHEWSWMFGAVAIAACGGATQDSSLLDPPSGPPVNWDLDAGADGATDSSSAMNTGGGGDVFADAGAYAGQLGPSTRKGDHDFTGNTPATNPAGQACMTCHGKAGPGPLFQAGGTVYVDATKKPASSVEVRIVGANGAVISAYTDADGNFYVRQPTIAFPAKVGVRDAQGSRTMSSTIANGDCNNSGCHGGSQGPIVLR
jgi:hypothetical protein